MRPAAALSLAAAAALGVGALVGTQQGPTGAGTGQQASAPSTGTNGQVSGPNGGPYPAGALPDPRLTPGDTVSVDLKTLCTPLYSVGARNVPDSEKTAVYSEYHATRGNPPAEVDHLCPLALGGSNSILNLWPSPWHVNWNGKDCGARVKDVLESELHREVCSGKLPLAQAQEEIRRDWIATYQRHIGPLPAYPFGKDSEPERP